MRLKIEEHRKKKINEIESSFTTDKPDKIKRRENTQYQ